ncbi:MULTISPECIES: sporulation histidine kinase inhibitor Sda [Paenibacillus]|uniref:Sporulation histidine kinase inhibitor Sda n=1 Tax=Paenibacillus sambharensis TaxID=1803190 RepID=A0A2W1LRA5_9BACL|nr:MULTISPECIES: sporulation histidine kinase inhibitor Sda [Paenibacillus]MCF2943782.1 sporulation histidine kinase inhibitor Sda [Paenibacillus tarimensis]PZD94351.1 sporulation histidine kinase inhibitor Sda [Paenibacillus sambharensis]
MDIMSDELLLEAYHTAVKLKLDPDFIRLLAVELVRRGVKPDALRMGA